MDFRKTSYNDNLKPKKKKENQPQNSRFASELEVFICKLENFGKNLCLNFSNNIKKGWILENLNLKNRNEFRLEWKFKFRVELKA